MTGKTVPGSPSGRRFPLRRLSSRTLAGLVLFGLWPVGLQAELVVFSGGDVLEVVDYELRDDKVRLVLPSGGALLLPLSRIERVVDDEIVPPSQASEAVGEGAGSETLPIPLRFHNSQPIPSTPFGELIHATARQHLLNPQILAAMTRAESGFNPMAISPKGARGLMQLMPATAQRFGVDPQDLFQPAKNLEAAARYLNWLLDRFPGDLAKILAAYNAGEGAVKRYGGIPPYRETRSYVKRIYSELGLEVGW